MQSSYILVQICAGAVFSCQFAVKSAAQVADVALGADEENRHLKGTTTNDKQTDDVALLFSHGLVGLVHSILLLEGCEELRMELIYLILKGLPFFCPWMCVLS